MLDVHPPHEAVHTWKDFLIHIATICVGLLIAIGLEQSVEALHHHHQREQLLASIEKDTRATLRDENAASIEYTRRIAWDAGRIKQVRQALASHTALADATPFVIDPAILPADPSFDTAKTSGTLLLLSPDEIAAYNEVDVLIEHATSVFFAFEDARRKRLNFERRYASLTDSGPADYSRATPADLETYLDRLLDEQSELISLRSRIAFLQGAEAAILDGTRDHYGLMAREIQTAKSLPR